MNKFKMMVVVMLLIVITKMATAQSKTGLDLKIGDAMPDITFRNLKNYKTADAKLSDFKGKLVILDFWFTKCSACIDGFPKMDSLQKKFGDQLQVILVNTRQTLDTKETVEKRLKRLKESRGYEIKLPYMYGDTVLEKYITYRYLPHYVWINGDRKIVAITSGEEITGENILKVLKNQKIDIRYKKDDMSFDPTKPLFINNNGNPGDAIVHRSILTEYVEGLAVSSSLGIEKFDQASMRYFAVNNSIKKIFNDAFNIYIYPENNRWVIETSKSDLFSHRSQKTGGPYTYCYELIAKANSEEEFKSIFRNDLSHIFKVDIAMERRLREVYILKPVKRKIEANLNDVLVSLRQLDKKLSLPLIYEGNEILLNIKAPANYNSFNENETIKMLKDLGFSIKKEQREIEVLVFKDVK